jgi:hypothetical protein
MGEGAVRVGVVIPAPTKDGYYWIRDHDGWLIAFWLDDAWGEVGEEQSWSHEQEGIEELYGPLDEPSAFTSGAFVVPQDDAPVIGWMTMRAEIDREEIEKHVERAVVITAKDSAILRDIRREMESAAGEREVEIALLTRLIGKGRK